jgi:hypothetical protein
MPIGSMCVADSSSKVYSHVRMDVMDKLVKRVVVVQGSGENRHANVVYKSDEDKDEDEDFDMPGPNFKRIEESVRHMLKAQVIAAQDAYQRHLNSVEKGGKSWIYDAPGNFMRARRKALKEVRKAAPFGMPKMRFDDDDDEDDGD